MRYYDPRLSAKELEPPMNKLLIKNATLVNEGRIYASDVLIEGERIARIAPDIEAPDALVIDAAGRHLIPRNDR